MSLQELKDKTTIAIDAMGGDFGPDAVLPGLNLVLKKNPHIHFILFGDRSVIEAYLSKHASLRKACTIEHTDFVVKSDEKPSAVLRSSKGSSMRMAIEAVKDGRAQAVVSSGNTGALMALSKLILRPVSDIRRPAIASVFPTMSGEDTIMLDLGANVLVDAQSLVQFAVLGSVFAKAHKEQDSYVPSVGLLNVGSEDMKGPDHVRAAAAILSEIDFPGNYVGFVEGNDITKGTVDVVVCDGYVGNIALKTAEGVGKMSNYYIKRYLKSDPLAILGAMLSYFALRKAKNKVDPRLYNGGVFLGLNGISVKSHGGADALAFSSAVKLAVELSRESYIETVSREIHNLMGQETFLSQEGV